MSNPDICAVVAHDPLDDKLEGTVITGTEVQRLETRGVALVRADFTLATSPLGCAQGYVRRAFGDGLEINSHKGTGPQLLAPLVIRAVPGKNFLEWVVGLVGPFVTLPQGVLRLAVPPILASGLPPGMRTLQTAKLGEMGATSGELVTLKGEAMIEVDHEMFLPLCLSATGAGAFVRWLAVGQRIVE